MWVRIPPWAPPLLDCLRRPELGSARRWARLSRAHRPPCPGAGTGRQPRPRSSGPNGHLGFVPAVEQPPWAPPSPPSSQLPAIAAPSARVMELEDKGPSRGPAARRAGSNPASGTTPSSLPDELVFHGLNGPHAQVLELVDNPGSNLGALAGTCGFDSHPGHQFSWPPGQGTAAGTPMGLPNTPSASAPWPLAPLLAEEESP